MRKQQLLFDLNPGDRFYFVSDKSRKIWQLAAIIQYDPVDEGWRLMPGRREAELFDDLGQQRTVRRNYPVIFIRSTAAK